MVFWVFHLLGILPGYFTELLEFVGIISFEKLFKYGFHHKRNALELYPTFPTRHQQDRAVTNRLSEPEEVS